MSKEPLSTRTISIQSTPLACLLLCLVLVSLPQTSLAEGELPDIGGSASTELSPAKEIEVGRILLTEVRRRLPVSNDPELSQYIQALGTRITSGGLNSNFPFTFLLVINPSVNAFALPGGIIAINSGLLTLAQQESELAGVLAHEIAHVSQRHIARNFESGKSLSLISALTLLGSILAAIYDIELGQAALMSSQAGLHQTKLAYSRSFEQEADRLAIQLLARSGIDPLGMPRFFRRLHEHTQLNRGQIPEFLSTHPLTLNRISESEARASQYRGSFVSNSFNFEYAKARTLAISKNPSELMDYYKEKNKSSSGLSDTERYTYALVLGREGKHKQALRQLGEIVVHADNELTIKLAAAQIHIAMGQAGIAKTSLESLDKIYPQNFPVAYYLAKSLIKENQAHGALEKLDRLGDARQKNPAIDQLKAKAADKAGLTWRSHESLGDYYAAHGQYGLAMEQIELALRSPGIDLSSEARIEARKTQLRETRQKHEQFK